VALSGVDTSAEHQAIPGGLRIGFTPNELQVTVLDVGQGDSVLVVSPRGSALLSDGGAFEGFPGQPKHLRSDPGEDAVSAYLWWRGFKKLKAIAVTHARQDPIGGMTAILKISK
jgi:competence protein ComEC